jgi:hypothetical protein
VASSSTTAAGSGCAATSAVSIAVHRYGRRRRGCLISYSLGVRWCRQLTPWGPLDPKQASWDKWANDAGHVCGRIVCLDHQKEDSGYQQGAVPGVQQRREASKLERMAPLGN